VEEETQTRTFVYVEDGEEREYVETLFESAEGFQIWYSAELFESAEVLGHEGFIQTEVPEGTGVTFIMGMEDASLDMDVMLEEATSNFGDDGTYEEVTVGETIELETESGNIIKSIEVVHDDTADRFYAVSDGEKLVLITVSGTAESFRELGVYFDRMVQTIEFLSVEEA